MFTRRPSPALVVALVALFVALGGVSYAATALPRNSVGPLQIRANAVSSAKVQNHSLRAADFKADQLPKGARGPAGPAGAAGPAGPAGPAGAAGVSGLQVVNGGTASGTGNHTSTATCPTGKKAIGGGWTTDSVSFTLSIVDANVTSDGNSFTVITQYGSTTDSWTLTAQVVCATIAA